MNILAYVLFLSVTPLMLIYYMLGFAFSPKRWKCYLPFYIVTVFVFSYCYNPVATIDLLNYFKQVETYSKVSFKEVLDIEGDGLFVKNIIFWLIGRLRLPHLLPAITTSIVYGVSGYITCDVSSKYHAENRMLFAMLFQMMLLPYSSIVSNIRNVFSFSLIVLAVYLEFIDNKPFRRIWFLYVIPCFIHTSAILIVLLRVATPLLRKKLLPISIGVVVIPLIIQVIYNNISLFSFGGYFGASIIALIRKLYTYMTVITETERSVMESIYYSVVKVITLPSVVCLILLLFYWKKEKIDNNQKVNDYVNFTYMICLLSVVSGFIFIVPHYWRLTCAAIIAYPVVLVPLLKRANGKLSILNLLLFAVLCFMIMRFTLDVYRGFRNIDYKEFIFLLCKNNIILIGVQVLKNLILLA